MTKGFFNYFLFYPNSLNFPILTIEFKFSFQGLHISYISNKESLSRTKKFTTFPTNKNIFYLRKINISKNYKVLSKQITLIILRG